MKIRILSAAIYAVFGLAFVVAASPAEAQGSCASNCNCSASCDKVCRIGPIFDPDFITCGDWGLCAGSPACTPPACANLSCTSTINGTGSGDTLTGTSARECINGFGGDDTLTGNSGDDRLVGDTGNDTIYGNSGNDCLWGADGTDHLDGGTGEFDFGDGGAGTDTCVDIEDPVNCP